MFRYITKFFRTLRMRFGAEAQAPLSANDRGYRAIRKSRAASRRRRGY